MRKLLLGFLLLACFSGKAQKVRAPFNAIGRSLSVEAGPCFLLNQKNQLGASGSLSIRFQKGFGVAGGLRLGLYNAPATPVNYKRNSLVSLGGDDNLVTDFYIAPYGLLTYQWFPPKTRFLYIRGGLGLAVTKERNAHFKDHVSTSSAGSILHFPGPTHDVWHVNETVVGPAAQLGIYTYLPLSKSDYAVTGGLVSGSFPGFTKRFYTLEIQLGLLFPLRTSRQITTEK